MVSDGGEKVVWEKRGSHIKLDVGESLTYAGSGVSYDTDTLDLASFLAEDAP